MRNIRKTYAARGLLDFKMALNVAGAVIRICFSGGSMGPNGVVAAKYTTDNPAIQAMIEKSPQFLGKRIYVHSTYIPAEGDKQIGNRNRTPNNGKNDPEIDSPHDRDTLGRGSRN